jgi:hypothetical protein
MSTIENLIVDTASRAACHYLRSHGLSANVETLAACVRSHCKARLAEAYRDACDALSANMDKVACSTFLASFVLAGIEAAKEAGRPLESLNGDHLTP